MKKLLTIAALSSLIFAQSSEEIFKAKCATCHTSQTLNFSVKLQGQTLGSNFRVKLQGQTLGSETLGSETLNFKTLGSGTKS